MKRIIYVFVMLLIVSLVSATSDKVEVCHKGNTISISENAVKAHIAHGDYIGECTGNPGKSTPCLANLYYALSLSGFKSWNTCLDF